MSKGRVIIVLLLLMAIGIVGGAMTSKSTTDVSTVNSTDYIKVINQNTKVQTKVLNFSEKSLGFTTLNQLEHKVPIIIKGTKVAEIGQQLTLENEAESKGFGYTESNFKIKQIYKNKMNLQEIRVGTTVKIGELEYESNKQLYTTNGYQKMHIGEDYLLLLIPYNDLLLPFEIVYGKIPLHTKALEIYTDEQLVMESIETGQSMNELKNQIKPIYEAVRAKYGD